MELLLQNAAFRMKISSLSPATRRWFISSIIDLFEQESEYTIDVIEDCREEMRQAADRFKDEAEQLRVTSRMLEQKRESPDRSSRRSMSRVSTGSRLSKSCDRQGSQETITNRMRFRRRRIVGSEDDGYRSPAENSNSRVASSLSCSSVPSLPNLVNRALNHNKVASRSLPVTPTVPTEQDEDKRKREMQEKTRVILQSMSQRNSLAEKERERQQQRLESIRRQKRLQMEDRTHQALQLLEKALEMDKLLIKDKERQGLHLRQKVEDIKRKKGQGQISTEFVELIELPQK